jgi:hypothetical protein
MNNGISEMYRLTGFFIEVGILKAAAVQPADGGLMSLTNALPASLAQYFIRSYLKTHNALCHLSGMLSVSVDVLPITRATGYAHVSLKNG